MTDQAMSAVLQNVEDELKGGGPMPRTVESIDKYVPSKYRAAGNDSFELIQQDLRRTITELEKQVELYRKRIEDTLAGVHAQINEMKRLAG